jgi:biotin synthase
MLVNKLIENHRLSKEEYIELLDTYDDQMLERLQEEATTIRKRHYGNKVFTRGLIEYTNYCTNNCNYCGIRAENTKTFRYRLSQNDILQCCKEGYELGFRTFVLQGGEDPYFTDDRMVDIIKDIKDTYPDCALTLSIGEKSYESYRLFREAGADRYLLRHETANQEHYQTLHPDNMLLKDRKECLYHLKELGYQVGAGFMVGSPKQTNECLADDLLFLEELNPQMVGIGPFIPHHETPFANYEKGSVEKVILLLSIIRIILPKVLLPATTALGTLDAKGREKGLLAGANVVMPNLSPISVRKKYDIYDDKICTGEEAAECKCCLERRISSVGLKIVSERGDIVE